MGLRPMKLTVVADDGNGLEANEKQSRPMMMMGLRPMELTVEANDSNELEANEIDG
jgi:hypothetical protein